MRHFWWCFHVAPKRYTTATRCRRMRIRMVMLMRMPMRHRARDQGAIELLITQLKEWLYGTIMCQNIPTGGWPFPPIRIHKIIQNAMIPIRVYPLKPSLEKEWEWSWMCATQSSAHPRSLSSRLRARLKWIYSIIPCHAYHTMHTIQARTNTQLPYTKLYHAYHTSNKHTAQTQVPMIYDPTITKHNNNKTMTRTQLEDRNSCKRGEH